MPSYPPHDPNSNILKSFPHFHNGDAEGPEEQGSEEREKREEEEREESDMIIAMSGMKKHLKNVVKRLEEKLVTTAGHSLRNQT